MKLLFGVGKITDDYYGHFFIGGGVESGETLEEAIVREIREEAHVEGKIIFRLGKEVLEHHHTFLVDIGDQTPVLGYDPEDEERNKADCDKALQKLEFIPLFEVEQFTQIDIDYFKLLLEECKSKEYHPQWYRQMEVITNLS